MTLRAAAALLTCGLALPPPAAAADSWQYFCFESAAQFAAISPKTVFSVFPNPSAVVSAAKPAPGFAADEAPAAAEAAPAAAQSEEELIAAQLRELKGTCYFMRVGYCAHTCEPPSEPPTHCPRLAAARMPATSSTR